MKGLIFLFLAITLFGIAWGYTPKEQREAVKRQTSQNLLPIFLGLVAVALAVVFSLNTTLRLV